MWASEASLLLPVAPHETHPEAARKTVSVWVSITGVILMSSLKSRNKAPFLLAGRRQGFMSYGLDWISWLPRHIFLTIGRDDYFILWRIGGFAALAEKVNLCLEQKS